MAALVHNAVHRRVQWMVDTALKRMRQTYGDTLIEIAMNDRLLIAMINALSPSETSHQNSLADSIGR